MLVKRERELPSALCIECGDDEDALGPRNSDGRLISGTSRTTGSSSTDNGSQDDIAPTQNTVQRPVVQPVVDTSGFNQEQPCMLHRAKNNDPGDNVGDKRLICSIFAGRARVFMRMPPSLLPGSLFLARCSIYSCGELNSEVSTTG